MNTPTGLSADLPALPEDVETWILELQADADAQGASLHRLARSKWPRIAGWQRERDSDLHDWVLDNARKHVDHYGAADLRLQAAGRDSIDWKATVTTMMDDVVFSATDANVLLDASWRLTFKATHMMIDAASSAPRLVTEVTGLYKSAIDAMREALAHGDGASLKSVEAVASQKKMETLLAAFAQLEGSGGGGGNGSDSGGPKNAESADRMAANKSRQLLGAMTEDDLPTVLNHPFGRLLALANDWESLQEGIKGLFEAVTEGELVLSTESKDAARKIVKAINA